MQPKEEEKNTENTETKNTEDAVLGQIVEKIRESDSILIALSKDPNVDELATAISLGMFIDKMGKHATAIYSGATPNVLAFLQPEQQFETNTNGLQDFIIAINKDKADHLRYKLDGDFVKVYITPYRTTISESDLEFSHGDYNVDLVIALNVGTADQLDAALSEHGRIMHDATIVNVAAGVPGKFGEIEWSNPAASSVAEMIAGLMLSMQEDAQVDGEIATAVLTGIVAATERFSNAKTQPETMAITSQLMKLGANQQLISENIIKEEAPKAFEVERGQQQVIQGGEVKKETAPSDDTVLDVQAAVKEQNAISASEPVAAPVPGPVVSVSGSVAPTVPPIIPLETAAVAPTPAPVSNPTTPPIIPLETAAVAPTVSPEPAGNEEAILPPVVPEQAVLQQEPAPEFSGTPVLPPVMPEQQTSQPVESAQPMAPVFPVLDNNIMAEINKAPEPAPETAPVAPANPVGSENQGLIDEEKARIDALPGVTGKDYGSMIEEALSETGGQSSQNPFDSGYIGGNPALQAAPGVSDGPEENNIPSLSFDQPVDMSDERGGNQLEEESFLSSSPMKTLEPTGAPTGITVDNMEKETTLPMPGEGVLPPPPVPPLDFSPDELELPQVSPLENSPVSTPVQEPVSSAQPVLPTVPSNPSVSSVSPIPPASPIPPVSDQGGEETNPGAFKIPGM